MNDLMLHFLQDIHYAEKVGLRSKAKMAKAVSSPELRDAVLHHREQTLSQIERLDQVFKHLGKKARGKTCAAMDGLVEEGAEAMEEAGEGPVRDAALIACGQDEIAGRAVNKEAGNNGEEDEDGEGKDESRDAGAAPAKAVRRGPWRRERRCRQGAGRQRPGCAVGKTGQPG